MKNILAVWVLLACFLAPSAIAEPSTDLATAMAQTLDSVKPHDVFSAVSSCQMIDALTFRQYSIQEAAATLNPCLKDISANYKTPVTDAIGMPKTEGAVSIQIEMILIKIPDSVTATQPLYRDLNYSLSLRNRTLFGYPAALTQFRKK